MSEGVDFRHLPALRSLCCTRYWHAGFVVDIDRLPLSLEDVKLWCISMEPHGAHFGCLTSLRSLYLGDCQVPPSALSSLPPSITTLVFTVCTGLSASTFPPLPMLQHLFIAYADVGDAAIATLPPSLAAMGILGPSTHLTSAAAFPPCMPELTKLVFSQTGIGNATIGSLPPSLLHLDLYDCGAVTPAARLDHLVNLQHLNSSGTALAPSVLAACRAGGCAILSMDVLCGHGDNKVMSLAVLPDGTLASGDTGGTVRLWVPNDNGDGAYHACGDGLRLVDCNGSVFSLAALPDGRRLAACMLSPNHRCGTISTTVVWDLTTEPPTHATPIACDGTEMAFSPLASGALAVGCCDGSVRVMPLDAAATVSVMIGHTQPVPLLAVLPNGTLASGSWDRTVRLWDVGARACTATLAGHTGKVIALAALDDGRLASGADDHTVRLWDATSATCIGVVDCLHAATALAALPGGRVTGWGTTVASTRDARRVDAFWFTDFASVRAAAALPGNRVATASDDGTVRLWHLPPLPPPPV